MPRRDREIAQSCTDAGKPWGIVPEGEYAQRMRGWGCRMFVLAFDIHMILPGSVPPGPLRGAVLQVQPG